MGFGLLSYSTQGDWEADNRWDYECTPWSPNESQNFFDAEWKTAVAFGIIGVITTGIGLLAAIMHDLGSDPHSSFCGSHALGEYLGDFDLYCIRFRHLQHVQLQV